VGSNAAKPNLHGLTGPTRSGGPAQCRKRKSALSKSQETVLELPRLECRVILFAILKGCDSVATADKREAKLSSANATRNLRKIFWQKASH
jgi:hypothetical protein